MVRGGCFKVDGKDYDSGFFCFFVDVFGVFVFFRIVNCIKYVVILVFLCVLIVYSGFVVMFDVVFD